MIKRAEILATVALLIAIFGPLVSYIAEHADKPPTPPAMTDHGNCASFHYLPTGDFVCDRMEYPAGDGPEYTAKMVIYREKMETWYKSHPEER